jgi:hypothetical protein
MMTSAFSMVDSRCAITSVVRPFMTRSSAAWMWRSDSVSSADVASSRIRIGASFSSARAIARRWRWPPDSSTPFSPTRVSKPCGSCSMNSRAKAASAALSIAARGAPARSP